jgi:phosphoglycolate phosphatase-like HAD superfamily hydrolase
MKHFLIPLAMISVVLMQQPARASAPSPEDLDRWKIHEQQIDELLQKALPWKTEIEKVFSAESKEIVRFIFLTTYKHHVPDSGRGKPSALEPEAKAFLQTWKSASKACVKASVKPVDMADAIYRFTNSDWSSVSVATGPGLDKVAGPKDYQAWVNALIAVAKKAKKKGLDPASVWFNQAGSYQVHEPADLVKVGLNPTPPAF